MHGNAIHRHHDTAILSVASHHAPEVVTSTEIDVRLAETYDRVGAAPGLLENLAGIKERRWWPEGAVFADVAAEAGRRAIEQAGIDPSRIGLLIDTSVSRNHLEPSSAVNVHNQLDLPSTCLNFDLANACLGFLNGIQLAGTMIDSGQIDYALVVDGEGSRQLQEVTLDRLASPEATMADLFSEFASLTLGSGAAAMVLGRHSAHPEGHQVLGGVSQADTAHHRICVGSLDRMKTDSRALLDAAIDLAKRAWADVEDRGWREMDRYIIHQVSQVHTAKMCEVLGIDPAKVPLTFPFLGNVGPASIPITLADSSDTLNRGDKLLLLGIGSGINAMATEIVW